MSEGRLFVVGSVVCSFSMAIGVTGSANAESVSVRLAQLNGTAMVATDTANIRAVEGMQLRRGDRLMVMDGGSALVEYSDGCRYSVSDEMLLTIGNASACAPGVDGVHGAEISPVARGEIPMGSGAVTATPPAIGDAYPALPSVIYAGASAPAAAGVVSTGGVASVAAGSLAWVPVAVAGTVAVGAGVQSKTSSGNGRPPISP